MLWSCENQDMNVEDLPWSIQCPVDLPWSTYLSVEDWLQSSFKMLNIWILTSSSGLLLSGSCAFESISIYEVLSKVFLFHLCKDRVSLFVHSRSRDVGIHGVASSSGWLRDHICKSCLQQGTFQVLLTQKDVNRMCAVFLVDSYMVCARACVCLCSSLCVPVLVCCLWSNLQGSVSAYEAGSRKSYEFVKCAAVVMAAGACGISC